MAEKWKPVIHPVEEFSKFPWGKVAFEGFGGYLNIRFIEGVRHGKPRHIDIPRDAHIQFFLDGDWVLEESGGSLRPFEVWIVPDGLANLIMELEATAKDDLRRGIKDLLKIRDAR